MPHFNVWPAVTECQRAWRSATPKVCCDRIADNVNGSMPISDTRTRGVGHAIRMPDDCLLRNYDVVLPWRDGTPVRALESAVAE